MRWQGPIAVEGRDTVDGRLISPGALRWDLPLPLMEDPEPGSFSFVPLGRIEHIERRDDGIVWGSGTLDREPKGTSLELGADNAQTESVLIEDRLVMNGGRVRYVLVGNRPAWPECQIEVIPDAG